MGLHRLDNARWGFASNCFVCEPTNAAGLRISFVHDDQAGVVLAQFSLGDAFSGAPSYVHGGVVLAVMDEAMAWAAIAIAHTWALTRQSTATFWHPVLVDQPHTVMARLVEKGGDGTLKLSASVSRGDVTSDWRTPGADRCAEANATFVALSAEAAAAAVGEAPGPGHSAYLRPGGSI